MQIQKQIEETIIVVTIKPVQDENAHSNKSPSFKNPYATFPKSTARF